MLSFAKIWDVVKGENQIIQTFRVFLKACIEKCQDTFYKKEKISFSSKGLKIEYYIESPCKRTDVPHKNHFRRNILKRVKVVSSPLVVAGVAHLLVGEEDEAGGVLDLVERGEVGVQRLVGVFVVRSHVLDHVGLQLQVAVVALDDDYLEKVGRDGDFTFTQHIKLHLGGLVLVFVALVTNSEHRTRADVNAPVFFDQFITDVALEIKPWSARETRGNWDDIGHDLCFTARLLVEWVVGGVSHEAQLVVGVAVVTDVGAVVAVDAAVGVELGLVQAKSGCIFIVWADVYSPVTWIVGLKVPGAEMLINPVRNAVLGVIRDDEFLITQRFATGCQLRESDFLFDAITHV